MIKDSKIREWYEKNKDPEKNDIDRMLGVDYVHLKLENGDDLYVTRHGLPFIENLRPENFLTDEK